MVVYFYSANHRTSKKVKKSAMKKGCEQKISKNCNCLNKKKVFKNANICPCISPPKKNLGKRPLDQKYAPGLIIGVLQYFYLVKPVVSSSQDRNILSTFSMPYSSIKKSICYSSCKFKMWIVLR